MTSRSLLQLVKTATVLTPALALGVIVATEREAGLAALVGFWLEPRLWLDAVTGENGLQLAQMAAGIATSAVIVLVLWRTVLWLRYRPQASVDRSSLPTVSVVIPAYQEGAGVRSAILSAAQSEYPKDRLKIIVVDDGSSDDTFDHIQQAVADAREMGVTATALSFAKNRGKRAALHAGMAQSRSEIIVTLDSDSELLPDALAALVTPLVASQTKDHVGAVSGRVLARNRGHNLLTRMLWVQYVVGFDFTRAYQSQLGTVFCVPGACAAYRRELIAPQLTQWRDQRFLGARCTNGDDHHLTNLVLRSGKDVVYQSSATVLTTVPTQYRPLTRMYTRWARSNVRESLLYLGFAFPRAIRTRRVLPLIDGITKVITNFLRPLALIALVATVIAHPLALTGALVLAALGGALYGGYYLRYERSSEALLGIAYAYFSLLTLQWIYPYALLTVRQNRWLTR